MDGVTVLFGLAIALVVAAFVASPLLRKPGRAAQNRKSEIRNQKSELELEYRTALEAIRDLDFDFQTGKVLKEEYQPLRERYAAQGAALLKELDQLGGGDAAEQAIRLRRKQRRASTSDEIEAMIQARRKRASLTCPACGQSCSPEDRFCGKCGAALDVERGV